MNEKVGSGFLIPISFEETIELLAATSSILNSKTNLAPSEHRSYHTSPFIALHIRLQIWRPRPTPFLFCLAVESKKPKTLNSLGVSSCFIPGPLSRMDSRTNSYWFSFSILRHSIQILFPMGVNLIAFVIKASITCLNLS